MSFRSRVWNTSRSVRNYSKKITTQNVETKPATAPSVFVPKETPADQQELDDVFLNLSRMRIQPQVDPEAKKVHTPVGDLPVSPLMNPAYLAAKRKYAGPKAEVDYSKHGKMEKKLSRNPYAWALAGPVRNDGITGTLLPRFFLQDFAYVPHPETKAEWMVPVSLMSENVHRNEVAAKATPDGLDPENSAWSILNAQPLGSPIDGLSDLQEITTPEDIRDGKSAPKSDLPTKGTSRLDADHEMDRPDNTVTYSPTQHADDGGGYDLSAVIKGKPRGLPRPPSRSSYTLCRRDILAAIAPRGSRSTKKGKQPNSKNSKAYDRMRIGMAVKARVANPAMVVYRADMDSFVLDLMRTRTMDQLLHYARICDVPVKPKKYLTRCEGQWDEVKMHTNRGCVLWLGDCEDQNAKKPGEFETVRLEGVKLGGVLPVHDLTVLLGQENVKRLREESIMFSEGSTFVLGGQPSSRLQLKLWKLQGYLASYKENPQD